MQQQFHLEDLHWKWWIGEVNQEVFLYDWMYEVEVELMLHKGELGEGDR